MTDLCHNCGDSHLPNICKQPLTCCDICQQFGHAYTFCPASVRRKIRNYNYLMLCHNCAVWHLPEPCQQVYHHCAVCGHNGHLERYCPIQPSYTRVGPTGSSWVSLQGQAIIQPIDQAIIRNIRIQAARETLSLVQGSRVTSIEIMNAIAHPNGSSRGQISVIAPQTTPPATAKYNIAGDTVDVKPPTHKRAATEPETPTPNHLGPVTKRARELHTPMQSGCKPSNLEEQSAHEQHLGMTETVATDKDNIVVKPRGEAKPAQRVTRCATCIARHKKCEHNVEPFDPALTMDGSDDKTRLIPT